MIDSSFKKYFRSSNNTSVNRNIGNEMLKKHNKNISDEILFLL